MSDRHSQDTLTTLKEFGDIRMPKESDEPILAPGPRAALMEWQRELESADELKTAGLKPRSKSLLYGPPGTGKTTMAHHLAARLGLPLLCIRSESVISMWVGHTGENLGKLFDALRIAKGKVAIFFDEFDALASKRQGGGQAGVERGAYLNVLLRRIEMDQNITFAATNRKDILDPAIWRRFDMQISVDLPGDNERFAILKRYAQPIPVSDADLDILTEATAGASPDLLKKLMEGVKRAKILWPKLQKADRYLADPLSVFDAIISSVAPPPEIPPPPLWSGELSTVIPQLKWPW